MKPPGATGRPPCGDDAVDFTVFGIPASVSTAALSSRSGRCPVSPILLRNVSHLSPTLPLTRKTMEEGRWRTSPRRGLRLPGPRLAVREVEAHFPRSPGSVAWPPRYWCARASPATRRYLPEPRPLVPPFRYTCPAVPLARLLNHRMSGYSVERICRDSANASGPVPQGCSHPTCLRGPTQRRGRWRDGHRGSEVNLGAGGRRGAGMSGAGRSVIATLRTLGPRLRTL